MKSTSTIRLRNRSRYERASAINPALAGHAPVAGGTVQMHKRAPLAGLGASGAQSAGVLGETNFPRTVDAKLPRRHGNHLRIVVFVSFTRRGGDSRVCPYGATTNARNVATTTQSLTMDNGKIQTISRHHRKRGDRRHSLSLIEIKPKDAGYAANRR